jgi:hypothetical protein
VSAVILAVIVVMWAVVLVPMWLRRHDAATESRSVDRFSTAMRVLSRRGGGSTDRRYVLMPKRQSAADVHVSGASAPRRPARRPSTKTPPARPKSRTLAARRRRFLLGLAGVAFLTFVLMVAGAIAWPFQFVIDLVLVAFVVHLRTQAKRAAAISRERRRAAARSAHLPAPHPARRATQAPAAPSRVAAPAPAWADETTVLPPIAEPPTAQPAVATGTDDAVYDASGWDPVPVPPPTYTMKPKAPPRRTWTPPAAQPAASTEGPAVSDGDADELDGILEHRWAVND